MPLPKLVPAPTHPPTPNPSHFISQLDNTVGKSRQHETYSNKTTNPRVSVPTHRGALLCCSPGNAAGGSCTFHGGHTPSTLHSATLSAAEPQDKRPNTRIFPPGFLFRDTRVVLRARQQRSVSTTRCFSTNPKSPVQHGVRHVDKRDASRTQREQGQRW